MKRLKCFFVGMFVGLISIVPVSLRAETAVQIRHTPLLCAVEELPVAIAFEALAPEPPVEVRVYFKPQQAEAYYFVRVPVEASGKYTAALPAPKPDTTIIDYLLLVVDDDGRAVKTEPFSAQVDEEQSCPQYQQAQTSPEITVFAEETLLPEVGFTGKNVIWDMTSDTPSLLENAQEIALLTDEPVETEHSVKITQKSGGLGKKTLIGLGLGAGAAAGAAIALGGDGGDNDDGSSWNSVDDVTKNVIAQVTKTPAVQTNCGVSVVNQLTVKNNTAAEILLGTIEYEVVLIKDKPAGSCVSGRSGGFAPDGVTSVAPGQTALVREWMNEVNPCGSCPYVSAECVWESRYVVHTSAGSAVARSTFSTQGNLCGSGSPKVIGIPNRINPDIEP